MRAGAAFRPVLAAAAVLPALLAACQVPRILLVGEELPELTPVVEHALASESSVGHWTVQEDTVAVPANATVVRLTTTPGWNLGPSHRATRAVPDSWDEGSAYRIAPSLERVVRARGSSWASVPLLFDAWGQTRRKAGLQPGTKSGPAPDWPLLVSRSPSRSVAVAGSRPSFRQWALIAGAADPAARVGALPEWFAQGAQGWDAELGLLAGLKRAPVWAPDTWDFRDADVRQGFRADSRLVVLVTFRDYERSGWSGLRSFTPLAVSGPSGNVLGGPVVFAELSGNAQAWTDAAPLLRLLAAPPFQRDAAAQTQWLPANLEAPEIDDTGAAVRYLVRQARAFAPLTDRLPRPLVEGSLLVQAQMVVDRAPRG